MKIKIIFVVIAVVFAGIGAISGSWITSKSEAKNREIILTFYQEKNKEIVVLYQEMRSDYKELAGKACYLIEQKLYIRKVKNGMITYDPTSTMDISKIIEDVEEKIKIPVDSLSVDTLVIQKHSWFYNLFH